MPSAESSGWRPGSNPGRGAPASWGPTPHARINNEKTPRPAAVVHQKCFTPLSTKINSEVRYITAHKLHVSRDRGEGEGLGEDGACFHGPRELQTRVHAVRPGRAPPPACSPRGQTPACALIPELGRGKWRGRPGLGQAWALTPRMNADHATPADPLCLSVLCPGSHQGKALLTCTVHSPSSFLMRVPSFKWGYLLECMGVVEWLRRKLSGFLSGGGGLGKS